MTASRYSRQELFAGIGREGQARLRTARVVVVGCGALGSVAGLTSVFLTNSAFLALGGCISRRAHVKSTAD